MTDRQPRRGTGIAKKALAVPLSVVLAAGCAPSLAFAEGLQPAAVGGAAKSAQAVSAAAASTSLYQMYLPVLFRATNGLEEFASAYQASDKATWAPEYQLFDIGNDGTPELLVRTSAFGGNSIVHVFAVRSGQAAQVGSYWEWFGGSAGNSRGELFTAGWSQGSSYVNAVMLDNGQVTTTFLISGKASESNPTGEIKAVDSYLGEHGAQWLSFKKTSDTSLLSAQAKYALSRGALSVAAAGAYTGAAKTPAVTVKFAGETLRNGTDFSVKYANNVNAGTATATITGMGDYQGTLSAQFAIAPANVSAAALSVAAAGAYTGAAKTPAVTARLGNLALRAGTDYTVAYKNNTAAGTGTATITGRGNFTGSRTASFAIARAGIASAAVSVASAGAYTGSAKTPKVTVKLNGATLKSGTDYKITFKNNKAAGTATAVIAGLGNYQGSKNASFAIAKAANPMTVKAAAKTLSRTTVAKAAQTFKPLTVSKAQGAVKYASASAASVAKVCTVNSSTGAITVKKGAAKGAYTVKVKVTAAGNGNYKAASSTASFKVTVK